MHAHVTSARFYGLLDVIAVQVHVDDVHRRRLDGPRLAERLGVHPVDQPQEDGDDRHLLKGQQAV